MAPPLITPQASHKSTLHDARTGFHDIKGLHPIIDQSSFITGKILLALAVTTLAYYLLKLFKNRILPQPILTPTQKAIAKLEKSLASFREQKVSPREHASQSSLILRDFLGEGFNFNATELTNHEVIEKLISNTKEIPEDPRKQLCVLAKKNLKSLEKNTFSDSLNEQFSEFEILCKESIKIIEFASECIKERAIKEKEEAKKNEV